MKIFKIVALVLLLAVIAVASMMIVLLSPKDQDNPVETDLIVSSGMSRSDISRSLHEEGIIRNQFAFFIYLRMIQATIMPGTYEVSSAQSASVIADNLASSRFKTARITVIEGWRARDIERHVVEDRNLTQLVGFADKAEDYEGYLFPDTYDIKVEVTIDELINLLRSNFARRTQGLNVTPETVILASIVEREAKGDEERPAIAQVYINRLNIGMRLQADATIQYAKGDWRAIRRSDYTSVISPYNTYLVDGLPKGPIANPGLASIKAVLEPEKHGYLFYLHAQGRTHFAVTYEEHNVNFRKYISNSYN